MLHAKYLFVMVDEYDIHFIQTLVCIKLRLHLKENTNMFTIIKS